MSAALGYRGKEFQHIDIYLISWPYLSALGPLNYKELKKELSARRGLIRHARWR